MTTPGMLARRELAALIKTARRERIVDGRGLSQAALAALIGCTQAKIQKIEAASVKIEPEDIEQVIGHLGVSSATARRMRQLVAMNAVGEPWSGERALVPRYARRYMDLEQVAAEILSWHEMRIPGPLQSTHLMLRQFNTAGKVEVAPYLRNRERRRKLFHQPELKRYHCVLAEEALHRAARGLGRSTGAPTRSIIYWRSTTRTTPASLPMIVRVSPCCPSTLLCRTWRTTSPSCTSPIPETASCTSNTSQAPSTWTPPERGREGRCRLAGRRSCGTRPPHTNALLLKLRAEFEGE